VVAPDLRGCDIHSLEDWRLYQYKSGRIEKRCLVCCREKSATHHNNGPRCRRGHLKTPWTWRRYGSRQWGRCLTCQYEKRRAA